MVPAIKIGYVSGMSSFQLKITQQVIAQVVFALFAVIYLKEPLR